MVNTDELSAGLQELDRLLSAQPVAARQLRLGATASEVESIAQRMGVVPPATIRILYGWHDGTARTPGDWELNLFPSYWHFQSLELIEQMSSFPLDWCHRAGVEGFPFAKDPTGQWLVAQSGMEDKVLQVSSDFVTGSWPDGTMLGLVQATCQALKGQHVEFAAEFSNEKMEWVFPRQESLDD